MTKTVETGQRLEKPSKINSKFKYEISKIPGGENLLNCFQCGMCTSACPIARFSETYRPRQIIRMTQLGLKKKVLSLDALWLCASCFTCTDRCPQNVKVADLIRTLRNLAARQGYIPRVFKDLGSSILKTGYAYRIPELRIKRREAMDLPPLPKGNPKRLTKILRNMRFPKFLEKKEN